MAEQATATAPKTKVTIRRGTVRIGGPVVDKQTGNVEWTTEDKGPGDEIEVTDRELAGLIARGQVDDPEAGPVPVADGPSFSHVAPQDPAPAPAPKGRRR